MIPESLSRSKLAKLRESIRSRIAREWHSAKRFDYSQAELATEVEARLERLFAKHESAGQMTLALDDSPSDTSAATRREACNKSQAVRIGRCGRMLELLKSAGADGLTRSELATRLSCRPSDLCSEAKYLVDHGHATQPRTRKSPRGFAEAVIVLKEFGGQP